jgi:hypothetical protein
MISIVDKFEQTTDIKVLMDKFYKTLEDQEFLITNPLHRFITSLKIDLKNIKIEKVNGEYPRIRRLEVIVHNKSFDYFVSVLKELDHLEELDVLFYDNLINEINFDIFPKTVRFLNLRCYFIPKCYKIHHPRIEELSISYCDRGTVLDIDNMPHLIKFDTRYFKGRVICSQPRVFYRFDIEQVFISEWSPNVLVYSPREKKNKYAFDINNENVLYDETLIDRNFRSTYIDRFDAVICDTYKISEEFYEKRPGITGIEFRNRWGINVSNNTSLHQNIREIICDVKTIGDMICFENLEKITVTKYNDNLSDESLINFFRGHPNKNLQVLIYNAPIPFRKELFQYGNRLKLLDKIQFSCTNDQFQNCIDFIYDQCYQNTIIHPIEKPCNIEIDTTKFNYLTNHFTALTRKPANYIHVRKSLNSAEIKTNCKKIIIEEMAHSELIDLSGLFDDVTIINSRTTYVGQWIVKCPPIFNIKKTEEDCHKNIHLSFPRGFKQFSIDTPELGGKLRLNNTKTNINIYKKWPLPLIKKSKSSFLPK